MMRRAKPWRGWRSRRSDHAQRPVSSPACNIISINRTIISANTPSRALEAYSTARASVLNVFLPSRARALDVLHASRARIDQRFPPISCARSRRSPCISRVRRSTFPSHLARALSTFSMHPAHALLNVFFTSRVHALDVRCTSSRAPNSSLTTRATALDIVHTSRAGIPHTSDRQH